MDGDEELASDCAASTDWRIGGVGGSSNGSSVAATWPVANTSFLHVILEISPACGSFCREVFLM